MAVPCSSRFSGVGQWVVVLVLVVVLLLERVAATGSPLQRRIPPFVTPTQFCHGLPTGQYCNVNFPRELITCPASESTLCPPNYICKEGNTEFSTAYCGLDTSAPAMGVCQNTTRIVSRCLTDTEVIECPTGTRYSCNDDLVCQVRGLRAYCVKPVLITSTKPIETCAGFTTDASFDPMVGPMANLTVCDAVNLRRLVTCPSGASYICPTGSICSVQSSPDATSSCVPWTADLNRFCSNKPIFSSFCLPGDAKGRFVQCGYQPTVLACPFGKIKCVQSLSLTARCV